MCTGQWAPGFKQFVYAGREHFGIDEAKYGSNAKRVQHQREIDEAITEWTMSQPNATAVCSVMDAASIPNGKVGTSELQYWIMGLFVDI